MIKRSFYKNLDIVTNFFILISEKSVKTMHIVNYSLVTLISEIIHAILERSISHQFSSLNFIIHKHYLHQSLFRSSL